MTSGRSTIIDITGELRHETAAAVMIFDGSKEVWLPKSLVEIAPNDDGKTVTVSLPEWLAEKEGLT